MRLFLCLIVLVSMSIGQNLNEIETVNVSAGDDSTIMRSSRAIKSDCDCIIKYRTTVTNGSQSTTGNVVDSLVGGVWYPVRVTRVYRYTSGTTETTCKTMDSTATQVVGVKIGR